MNEIPADASHVLAWMPPYFLDGGRAGYWQLMTVAQYDGAGWQPDDEWCSELPRSASFDALADWVATRIDFPFMLSEDTRRLKGRYWCSRWHTEPVFYVEPDPADESAISPADLVKGMRVCRHDTGEAVTVEHVGIPDSRGMRMVLTEDGGHCQIWMVAVGTRIRMAGSEAS